jgi:hypothetical protein
MHEWRGAEEQALSPSVLSSPAICYQYLRFSSPSIAFKQKFSGLHGNPWPP